MTAPRALVLGVSGQDGSYLAELLVARGYAVTGLVRRAPDPAAFENLATVAGRVDLVQGDVADTEALRDLVATVRPREIYNVASTSTLQAAILRVQLPHLAAGVDDSAKHGTHRPDEADEDAEL